MAKFWILEHLSSLMKYPKTKMRPNFRVIPPNLPKASRKPNRISSTTLVSWMDRPENAKNGQIWGFRRHINVNSQFRIASTILDPLLGQNIMHCLSLASYRHLID